MKNLVAAVCGSLLITLSGAVFASGGGVHLETADVDLSNRESLQRGAKYFVNYCLNCHSARYMRYDRMGRDLGLDEAMLKDNLMFIPGRRVGETMEVAMPKGLAEGWFGVTPPDLSLVARSRGEDWLYTYLKSFYASADRPLGVDNLVFPKVGMPNVLETLQGVQTPEYHEEKAADGSTRQVIDHLKLETKGSLEPGDFDLMVRDLVTFMVYLGEPAQMQRKSIGIWVLLFLVVFTILAYLLKHEYWDDYWKARKG